MSNPLPNPILPNPITGGAPPTAELNPTMALARAVIADPNPSAENRQLINMDLARKDIQRKSLFERQERMSLQDAMAKALMEAEQISTQAALQALAQKNKTVRLAHLQMVQERQKNPVQQDIAQVLGISTPSQGNPSDQGTEEAPMSGQKTAQARDLLDPRFAFVHPGTKTSEGPLLDASLVGFQDDADSPLKELYLQSTLPDWKVRAARAGLYGTLGGAAGGVVGLGANKLLNTVTQRMNGGGSMRDLVSRFTRGGGGLGKKLAPLGIGLGSLAGGLYGGLSKRPVNTAYDTSTGESASWADEAKAREITTSLNPSSKPGNFVIAQPGDLPNLGDQEPLFSYAADVDDLALENPEFFEDV
jgi:hypothetical protein